MSLWGLILSLLVFEIYFTYISGSVTCKVRLSDVTRRSSPLGKISSRMACGVARYRGATLY